MRDLRPILRRLGRRYLELPIVLVTVLVGLILALLLIGCVAADAMPREPAGEPVVTGTRPAPFGAVDLCARHPEELRCRPIDD